MKIESALDIISRGLVEDSSNLDKGFLLLNAFVKYQNSKLSKNLDETYKHFLDYVLFVEGLQYPFFYCLNRVLSNSETIGKLCTYIINLQCKYDKRLNAKEAYQLLLHINNDFYGSEDNDLARSILDAFNLPDKVYSPATVALSNKNIDSFIEAFGNEDCTEMMKSLWILKFMLYGMASLEEDEKLYNSVWFNNQTYDIFFLSDYDVVGNTKDKDTIINMMKMFVSTNYSAEISHYKPIPAIYNEKQYKLNSLSLDNTSLILNSYLERYIKNIRTSSDESFEHDCKNDGNYLILNSLKEHKDVLKKDFDKNFFDTLESKLSNYYLATNKPFKYYIELYLAKISFSYNMVKNALPDDGIKFLIKQIDRFPDLKKWIIGPDSFFDVYFTRLFPVKEKAIIQNKKQNSKANIIDNSLQEQFDGKCSGITIFCPGQGDQAYILLLKYLYSFLTGQFAFKDPKLTSDEAKNMKLDLGNKTEYINAKKCSEEDFIYILCGKKDKGSISKNPIIEWINTQISMAAFFYACCAKDEVYAEEMVLSPDPGLHKNCYSYNGKEIKLSIKKELKGIERYYKSWKAVIRLCNAEAKRS